MVLNQFGSKFWIRVSRLLFSIIRTWCEEQQPTAKSWVKIFAKYTLPPTATKLERAGTKIFLH